ncbi:MAG: HAMP domain-containing protein [Candidatus Cloacimonetes bacterium]|nr:HAMP domain-containing protein [Candidatus Cloacimonadota bacterium]
MNRSIFHKILGSYLLLIAGLALAFLLVTFHLVNNQYERLLGQQLESTASSLEPLLAPCVHDTAYAVLDSLVKTIGQRSGYRLTCILPSGVVVADSESEPARMTNHGDRPEIIVALGGSPGSSFRYSATLQREMLYVAVPFVLDGEVSGVLRLSMFNRQIIELRNLLKSRLALMLLPLALLAATLAFVLSNNLARPIRELSQAAKRVAEGQLDVQVHLHRSDEVQTLAQSFNEMVNALRSLMTQQKQQTEILDAIICSLSEGLCVIDADDRIVHASDSFRKMFGWRDEQSRFFWEVIRNRQANDFVQQLRQDDAPGKQTLEIDDKILLVSGSVLPDFGHVVLLLYDLTALTLADRQKREFVSNVSHELKTPLTSIKGFIETLYDVVEDAEARHYIEIVERNANRLIHIVKDLLLLSTLDADKCGEFADTDLAALIENVCLLFRKRFSEKELRLEVHVPAGLPLIEADGYQLEQVITNLLQNALQYTEKGVIAISCTADAGQLHLAVSDTGIGIPQQHLPHLFERFYVVDKSRSKKYGGTGLGLSIVKQVVERHRGSIEVDTQVGEGATFHVRLPMRQPAAERTP